LVDHAPMRARWHCREARSRPMAETPPTATGRVLRACSVGDRVAVETPGRPRAGAAAVALPRAPIAANDRGAAYREQGACTEVGAKRQRRRPRRGGAFEVLQ